MSIFPSRGDMSESILFPSCIYKRAMSLPKHPIHRYTHRSSDRRPEPYQSPYHISHHDQEHTRQGTPDLAISVTLTVIDYGQGHRDPRAGHFLSLGSILRMLFLNSDSSGTESASLSRPQPGRRSSSHERREGSRARKKDHSITSAIPRSRRYRTHTHHACNGQTHSRQCVGLKHDSLSSGSPRTQHSSKQALYL